MDVACPKAEAQRLTVLRSLEILDTPPEAAFDLFALAARKIAGTEMALVSLVDEDRQWFKARCGLDGAETPRAWAFCAHTILGSSVLCVEDAALDPRFRDNPLVVGGPRIRAYAGAPIQVDGHNVGAVCAISAEPQPFDLRICEQLMLVARAAGEQMSMRRALAAKSGSVGEPSFEMKPLVLRGQDTHDLLERRTDPELIEKGLVHVISLASIREQMGDRWTMRADGVWSYAERLAVRELEEEGYLVRLDDVHALIGQPSSTPRLAQARAVGLLRHVLQFYLGADAPAEVRVDRVTGVQSDSVTTEPLSLSSGDAGGEDAISPAPISQPHTGDLRGSGLSMDVTGMSEHAQWWLEGPLGVAFAFEPVWTIRTQAIVSYRMSPSVTGEPGASITEGHLTLSNLIGHDEIVLREASRLLMETVAPLVLHVPLHHATLSSVTGRQLVTAMLSGLGEVAKTSIIVSIVGLDDGAPQSRVAALSALLTGLCRGVVVRARSLNAAVERWRGAQLLAVSIDLSSLQLSERELVAELPRFAARASQVCKGIVANSVPSRSVLLAAWGAGFTHISGSVLQGSDPRELEPKMMQPKQFWLAS